ncbi:MAG: hypothetical protein N2Z79_05135 [Candidatus Omnitrophica bacterium]|nr:hypothetical protein [Candidatus Omnitrophota bacterium]
MKGLATGIGSFPYKEPSEALRVIFKYTPEIPFWPQLPKRNIFESMIVQFSEGLNFLNLKENTLAYDSDSSESKLQEFYEHLIEEDLEYFRISRDYALGLYEFYDYLKENKPEKVEFIKLQITGPFTFAGSINDENKMNLLYNPPIRQAILEGLAMKAKWQIEKFKAFNKTIILFIDEPYLACFGSGYTALNREELIRDLEIFTQRIAYKDTILGIHCCANTDWSIFMQVPYIRIISFDAYDFLERFLLYPKELNSFLKREGILAWGVVPTRAVQDLPRPESLVERVKSAQEKLAKKGVDKELLETKVLLTPSCGLGNAEPEEVEKIFSLLAEVSSLIKN